MREWLRERPWIWIVIAFVLFVILNLVFLVFAEMTQPEVVS